MRRVMCHLSEDFSQDRLHSCMGKNVTAASLAKSTSELRVARTFTSVFCCLGRVMNADYSVLYLSGRKHIDDTNLNLFLCLTWRSSLVPILLLAYPRNRNRNVTTPISLINGLCAFQEQTACISPMQEGRDEIQTDRDSPKSRRAA